MLLDLTFHCDSNCATKSKAVKAMKQNLGYLKSTSLLLVAFSEWGEGVEAQLVTCCYMSVLFLLLIEVVFDHLGGQLVQQLPSPCISHVAVCNLSLWHSFSGCHLVFFFFFYCLCNCAYVNGQVAVYHAAL